MSALNGYTLFVRQQPIASRACGSADRPDRRPIDPIVIVQLSHDNQAQLFADGEKATFFCVSTLIEEPEKFEGDNSQSAQFVPVASNLLTGTILSSIFYLKYPAKASQMGAFFVFPDLNIRSEGTYKLRFDVFRMSDERVFPVANCISAYFTVFSAKRFPGMTNSTELSKTFSDQGLKIRIRKDIRVRKKPRISHTGTSLSHSQARESGSPESDHTHELPTDVSAKKQIRPKSPTADRPDEAIREASTAPKTPYTEVVHHHHHHHYPNTYDFEGYFNDQKMASAAPLTTPHQTSYTHRTLSNERTHVGSDISTMIPSGKYRPPSSAHYPPRQIFSMPGMQIGGPPVKLPPHPIDVSGGATDHAMWRTSSAAGQQSHAMLPPSPGTILPLVGGSGTNVHPVRQSNVSHRVPEIQTEAESSTETARRLRLPSFDEAFAAIESGGSGSGSASLASSSGDARSQQQQQQFLGPSSSKYGGSFPAPPRQL